MTDRELFIKALDALEVMRPACFAETTLQEADTAITALRERLAQPEQEPFEYWNEVEGWVKIDEVRQHFDSVGCGTIYKTSGEDRVPVYTTPPQRKPLSDEEILTYKHMIDWTAEWSYINFARAIEAVHGIKENNQ